MGEPEEDVLLSLCTDTSEVQVLQADVTGRASAHGALPMGGCAI